MKKLFKKGFSMIELLFVMVILAALAAIAIPSMSSSAESATLTSMRSDIKNTITLLQSKYIDRPNYSEIVNNDIQGEYANESTGFLNVTLYDNTKIPLSKGNSLYITPYTLANGSCAPGQGYFIAVLNDSMPGKGYTYSPCTDGKIIFDTNIGF